MVNNISFMGIYLYYENKLNLFKCLDKNELSITILFNKDYQLKIVRVMLWQIQWIY